MAVSGFKPLGYQIQGPINFGGPASDYKSAYANALSINSQNYSNILAGYTGLTSSVLGNLQGQGAAQSQAITDQYAQAQGAANQSLISKGLGNTTVASSVNRGIGYDKAKAQVQLAGQTAEQYARYQAMLGQSQLGFMNSVSAPYPQAQQYVNPYAGLQPPQGKPLQMPMGGGYGGGSIGSSAHRFNPDSPGSLYSGGGGTPYSNPAAGGKAQNLDFGGSSLWAENPGDPSTMFGQALGQPATSYYETPTVYEGGSSIWDPSGNSGLLAQYAGQGSYDQPAQEAYPQSYGGEYVYPSEADYAYSSSGGDY